MEVLAKPGVAGIIENNINGTQYVLIQQRVKDDAPLERGLIEIPAGKIREFENIYDCLRREIKEEAGLEVVEIEGEKDSIIFESNGYRVLSYIPFLSSQNLFGDYPIMVQTFICRVTGNITESSNETQNVRWISLEELNVILESEEKRLYPMHVTTLKKYVREKLLNKI